jgi:lipopolysaccharide transport system permease protein
MWQDLKSSRELAWRLFVRDITAQYRQSIFGIFWAFVPPLITSLVFILLQSNNILNIGETDIPYPVYVLVGTILWQLFSESLNAPLKNSSGKDLLPPRVVNNCSNLYNSI